MKNYFLLLYALLLAACTSELEEQYVPSLFESVTMSAKDFECEKIGRTSFEITDKGAGFSWAAKDTVGIFPEEGAQAYFPMVEGVGTKTATFTGGGWALKSSSKYMAYYPMQGKFYLDKTAIPVDYTGQTQTGNASTAHLGQYDYMTAVGTSPQQGKVNFDFEHLGALVQLNLISPQQGTYTDVTLSCDESVFIDKGIVDLTAATPQIKPVGEKSKEIKIQLSSFTTTAPNENVQIYFLSAPVDLTGKTLKVFANKGIQQLKFESITINKPWNAGFSYALQIKGEPTPIIEWVDLGLPSGLLWASCNIGALCPEDYGDYFAWGETKPKDSYDITNSLTHQKQMSDISGNPQYDAATANWGTPARMPRMEDFEELINFCTTTWTTQNGVFGRCVKGQNDNSIFIPASGYVDGVDNSQVGKSGCCRSSTPNSNFGDKCSYGLNIESPDFFIGSGWNRYLGISVRPVRDK